MKAHHLLLPAALVVVAACGGSPAASGADATTVPADAASEGPLSPPPPAGGQQLASTTFHLEAGDEKYMCYQFRSPEAAVAVTQVDAIEGPGVHHLALYTAFGVEEPAAPHECDVLIKETWLPVFVSGAGSKSLAMPAGVGMPVESNTQYIMQLHLQNTTDSAIDVRAGVNLTYSANPAALQPAGIFGMGNNNISIPPGATDYQVKEHCAPSKDMNVFAVLGHMHKLGTALGVTMTDTAAGSDAGSDAFYTIDPWTFGNQPIEPKVTHVSASDAFDVTCHWNNPSADTIGYGESSDDEMCYFVVFYYPFDHLDGCVD